MTQINDELVGLPIEDALDRVMLLESAEEKAQALIHNNVLLKSKRGIALMRQIAAPTSPGCQCLYEVVQARDAAAARAKAERARRKAMVKPEPYVMPSLFSAFGAAPPSEEAKNIGAAPPPVET
ncbi:MAG TPA: hypothetical protein VIF02_16440 [Methylocella sp.]|jgi:hypothetical protein